MLPFLLDLVARLGEWSYLIIGLAAALECAAFAGLLVPGESLVLASGFLAHQGVAGPRQRDRGGGPRRHRGGQRRLPARRPAGPRLAAAARPAAGRDRQPAPSGRAILRAARTQGRLRRRFVGFARALVPFVAGASRMAYRRFVVYDTLGAALWTVTFVTVRLRAGGELARGRTVGRPAGFRARPARRGPALLYWLRRRRAQGSAAEAWPGIHRPLHSVSLHPWCRDVDPPCGTAERPGSGTYSTASWVAAVCPTSFSPTSRRSDDRSSSRYCCRSWPAGEHRPLPPRIRLAAHSNTRTSSLYFPPARPTACPTSSCPTSPANRSRQGRP